MPATIEPSPTDDVSQAKPRAPRWKTSAEKPGKSSANGLPKVAVKARQWDPESVYCLVVETAAQTDSPTVVVSVVDSVVDLAVGLVAV